MEADQPTLGDRAVAALLSLLFSLPVAGLLWLLVNNNLVFFTGVAIPGRWFAAGVAVFALGVFIWPRLAPAWLGRLWGFLIWIGRGD